MIRATSAKALPMLLGDPGGSVSLKTFDRMLDRMLDRFLDRLPSICRAVCSSPCDVVQERLSSASAKRFFCTSSCRSDPTSRCTLSVAGCQPRTWTSSAF